jgi:hypothetical protein
MRGDGAAGAPHDGRRVVEIDPREGGRKAVRIALAADLAVGDDVDPGALHVADREPRRIVLRRVDWTEISGSVLICQDVAQKPVQPRDCEGFANLGQSVG